MGKKERSGIDFADARIIASFLENSIDDKTLFSPTFYEPHLSFIKAETYCKPWESRRQPRYKYPKDECEKRLSTEGYKEIKLIQFMAAQDEKAGYFPLVFEDYANFVDLPSIFPSINFGLSRIKKDIKKLTTALKEYEKIEDEFKKIADNYSLDLLETDERVTWYESLEEGTSSGVYLDHTLAPWKKNHPLRDIGIGISNVSTEKDLIRLSNFVNDPNNGIEGVVNNMTQLYRANSELKAYYPK